jgi:hypothetical protein
MPTEPYLLGSLYVRCPSYWEPRAQGLGTEIPDLEAAALSSKCIEG